MNDFLDEKRREITDRLSKLKPAVDEYHRLEAAAKALAGVRGGTVTATITATATPARRGPGRPRGSGKKRRKAAKTATAAPATATATVTVKTPAKAATKAKRKVGRPAKRRAGRRKGSGTRAAEAFAFVKGQPGITIPELAAKMGIKQNYLYRVLPSLAQEGKVAKKGRGWYPKA